MHSDSLPPAPHAHAPDTVFVKTDKGRDEISKRSAALSAKQRSVLIMLDGVKPLHTLSTALSKDELMLIIGFLSEQQFVTARPMPASVPARPKAPGLRSAAPKLVAKPAEDAPYPSSDSLAELYHRKAELTVVPAAPAEPPEPADNMSSAYNLKIKYLEQSR